MKALIPVLESLGINHAISMDDDHALANTLSDYQLVDVDDFLSACGEELTAEEREIIDEIGATTIGDLYGGSVVPHELLSKIMAILARKERPMASLSFLETGFYESSVSYEKTTHMDSIQDAPNAGTIWFLDKEMGGRDVLPEVIPLISNKYLEGNNSCLIVVFTSDDSFDGLNHSWQKRFEYLSSSVSLQTDLAQKLSYSFFVISKKKIGDKLYESEANAQDYMEGILIDSLSGYCLYHIISQMKAYAAQSYVHLFEVAQNATQATIECMRYNMVTEGEPNVYHALKNIQNLMQEEEYTSALADCSKYILAMKRVALLPQESPEIIAAQAIDDIMLLYEWTQFQFLHRDINAVFSDVMYGDVFRIQYAFNHSAPKPYIGVLVTQPCDCVIRKNKKQVQRSAQDFTVLLFEEKSISKSELLGHEQKGWEYTIRRMRNEAIFIKQVQHDDGNWDATYIQASASVAAVQISTFILDLTSLNVQGRARLINGQELQEIVLQKKTQNWIPFLRTLLVPVNNFNMKQQVLLECLTDRAEDFLRYIHSVPFSIEQQEFAVERIGHLEDNLTELISYHYVSHTYRTGKNSLIALHNDRDE